MFPQVFEAVAGFAIKSEPCLLPGYARRKISGQVYPGIIKAKHSNVSGFLYKGLSQSQLHRLDQYESDEYLRELIVVRNAQQNYYAAWAYVPQPKCINMLTDEPWDEVEFEQLYLPDYLANINKENF
jgi:gamma-glutamylcyclotransferase (GGCT)/AIG2-like uncharacterized protein YtfP